MNELSFIDIIFNASLLVQIIMLLLLSISLFSWTLIFGKDRYLRKVRRAANQFEDEFLKGKDLTALYNRITSSQKMAVGMESIFITGYA
jgi:biopolymer transport protein TolQ